MVCFNCGNQVADDAVFCGHCGVQLKQQPDASVVAEEQPAESVAAVAAEEQPAENVAAETTVVTPQVEGAVDPAPQAEVVCEEESASQFAEVCFDEPAKKSKKPFIAIAAAVAAVVLVAVLVILNLSAVQGFFVKTFGSEADYLKYVEKKAFDTYTDDISAVYGNFFEYKDEAAVESQLKLNVSDEALSLAESYLKSGTGTAIELDWLNTISVNMDVNQKDALAQVVAALQIDGEQIVGLDLITAADKKEVFMGLIGLSDTYLKASTDAEELGVSTVAGADIYSDPEFRKLLPSDKELDKLLDKYLKIAIENLDDVLKEKDAIEVDAIEQKVTILELEIDIDTGVNIAKDILKEVKRDKELEKYITDIADYLEKEDWIEDADDVYDEFIDAVNEGLDELKDLDYENETVVTLTDYVNAKHEIIGRKLDVGGEDVFNYAIVRKGKEFAVEIEMPQVKLKGSGTEKNDIVDGEFSVTVAGKKVVKITVGELSYDEDDYGLNGNIRIYPTATLLEEMGIDSTEGAILSIVDLGVELNFEREKESNTVDFNILNADKLFAGLSITATEKKATDIEVPSDDKVVDSENADKWTETLDLDKLISALEKTSIPKEIVALLKSALNTSYNNPDYYDAGSNYYGGGSDYYDGYEYYDDDYTYYDDDSEYYDDDYTYYDDDYTYYDDDYTYYDDDYTYYDDDSEYFY